MNLPHEALVVAPPGDGLDAAALLNRDCACRSVDHDELKRALEGEAGGLSYDLLRQTHPHLFSDTRVYVAQQQLDFMADLIRVVESVVGLPAWRQRVLAGAPEIAQHDPKTAGVMLGYDFHIGDDGPRLIEINTNAGGALLNSRLLAAQRACALPDPLPVASGADSRRVEDDFVAMFREEWARARAGAPLTRIAIVDESPQQQFLAPEFELFRQLFEKAGIAALIADPAELSFDGQALWCRGLRVDLVYNRLTDFALDEPGHGVLRAAYLGNKVVVTPHPRAHALYADKRNLVALCDDPWLASIGVSAAERALLTRGVPQTTLVTPDNAGAFWATRRQWFFKPRAGFGSRAAYRGDKLTRRVFEEIAQGGYIAQALVRPSERRVLIDGALHNLKLDLRNYVYRDRVQLVSARLYQGQTTNFRTRGGGFAAVFAVPCASAVAA